MVTYDKWIFEAKKKKYAPDALVETIGMQIQNKINDDRLRVKWMDKPRIAKVIKHKKNNNNKCTLPFR